MLKLYVVGTPTPDCIKVFVGQDHRTAEEAVLTDDQNKGTKAVIVCDKTQADKIVKIVSQTDKSLASKIEDVGHYAWIKLKPILARVSTGLMYLFLAIAVLALLGNIAAFLNGNSTNPEFKREFIYMLLAAMLAIGFRQLGRVLRKAGAKL